jgi:mannobiose 2-epimerase
MPLADFFKSNFQYNLKYGYDNRRGGLYDHGRLKRKANARHKVWWPQAETLVCALEMYRLFNDQIYLKCFDKTLSWVLNYQIDWRKGEWHQRITPRGKTIGNKAELWKTPYHNGRAMIRCLKILEESFTDE